MIAFLRPALQRAYTFAVMALRIAFFGITPRLRTATDIFLNINVPVISVVFGYAGLPCNDLAGRIVTFSEQSLTTVVNGIRRSAIEFANAPHSSGMPSTSIP